MGGAPLSDVGARICRRPADNSGSGPYVVESVMVTTPAPPTPGQSGGSLDVPGIMQFLRVNEHRESCARSKAEIVSAAAPDAIGA